VFYRCTSPVNHQVGADPSLAWRRAASSWLARLCSPAPKTKKPRRLSEELACDEGWQRVGLSYFGRNMTYIAETICLLHCLSVISCKFAKKYSAVCLSKQVCCVVRQLQNLTKRPKIGILFVHSKIK
jgi:hypothetical protein